MCRSTCVCARTRGGGPSVRAGGGWPVPVPLRPHVPVPGGQGSPRQGERGPGGPGPGGRREDSPGHTASFTLYCVKINSQLMSQQETGESGDRRGQRFPGRRGLALRGGDRLWLATMNTGAHRSLPAGTYTAAPAGALLGLVLANRTTVGESWAPPRRRPLPGGTRATDSHAHGHATKGGEDTARPAWSHGPAATRSHGIPSPSRGHRTAPPQLRPRPGARPPHTPSPELAGGRGPHASLSSPPAARRRVAPGRWQALCRRKGAGLPTGRGHGASPWRGLGGGGKIV